MDDTSDGFFYQPTTEQTWEAYQALITLLNNHLGYQQPQIVQCLLAHEVLEILKDATLKNHQKKEMLEVLLNKISDDTFDMLLFVAEIVHDFIFYHDVGEQNSIQLQFSSGGGGGMEVDGSFENEVTNTTTDEEMNESRNETECEEEEEGGMVNPMAEIGSSLSRIKLDYSSEEEEEIMIPITDISTSLSRIKLEYSSEEEIMYLDYDEVCVQSAGEEDWVKVESDYYGI